MVQPSLCNLTIERQTIRYHIVITAVITINQVSTIIALEIHSVIRPIIHLLHTFVRLKGTLLQLVQILRV